MYLEQLLTQALPDLMREMLGDFINQILSAQDDTACGAFYGATSDNRVNHRNGYRHRLLDTRVGTAALRAALIHARRYLWRDSCRPYGHDPQLERAARPTRLLAVAATHLMHS